LQINRQNLKWVVRLMLLVLLVAVADSLVVLFARKPFPWNVLIPAILPVLIAIFVILPMIKVQKPAPPNV
jgi:predicted ferric reductase